MRHAVIFTIRKAARFAVLPLIFTLSCIALTGGLAGAKQIVVPDAVKEIAPGLLEGYLAHDALPNSLELLPPPPEEKSAGFALDEKTSQQSFAARDTARWEQAIQDANLEFPDAIKNFADVLEIPITEEDTPHLYMLLRRTLTDVGLSTYAAKTQYNRQRPFMKNGKPICTPADEEGLRKDGSYPSGHTAIGWAWALLLCEIFPEHADALLQRGWEFGQSRIICNVHWQSDVNQGRIMGAATLARLHADPGFLADLEAAKIEAATVRDRK